MSRLQLPLLLGATGGAVITLTTCIWWINTKRRRNKEHHEHGGHIQEVQEEENENNVSSRCLKASQSSPLPYLASFFKAISNPCHPDTNRDGYISLCVAENQCIISELSKKLTQPKFAKVGFGDQMNFCYNDSRGLEHVREAVAKFITKRFINPSSLIPSRIRTLDGSEHKSESGDMIISSSDIKRNLYHRLKDIPDSLTAKAEQIVIGSGASAILNLLFHFIAEENEVVLIPAPYYAAFEYDMSIMAKCVPYPVHTRNPVSGPEPDELEIVYQKLTKQGLKVKVLLLTNPNNPLGTICSPSVIKNCIDWAKSKKMHTIVDEIYALSVHDVNHTNSFQSVTEILQNKLGNDVHFVWALSKDFGSSGFRAGILYTQNKTILSAYGNLNMFSSLSHPMQAIIAELLSDDEYIDHFLYMNRSLLRSSYDIVTKGLDQMKIPFVPAQAGIFVYCDFSSLLYENSFESEDKLASLIVDYARIVMTPGCSQRDHRPGFFRICYAFVTPHVLRIAVSRLHMMCELLREHGWENIESKLNETKLLSC